jgi:hypothetical protein
MFRRTAESLFDEYVKALVFRFLDVLASFSGRSRSVVGGLHAAEGVLLGAGEGEGI